MAELQHTHRVKNTLTWFFTLFLLFGPGYCAAQKVVTWEDSFSSLESYWTIETQKNISYRIYNNELQILNRDAKFLKMFRREFPMDPHGDFTLETSITQISGDRDAVVGIVWGYEFWSDYHTLLLSADKKIRYYVYDCYEKTTVASLTDSRNRVHSKGMANRLRIEKKNDSVHVFVNDYRVIDARYIPHEGNELGFILDGSTGIKVDFIKVTCPQKEIRTIADPINGYELVNLGDHINSKCVENQPVISPDGRALFFSRDECYGNTRSTRSDIFYALRDEKGQWNKPEQMSIPMNNESHNFVISVTPDMNTLLVGNTYNADGTSKGPGVSVSERRNGTWSLPREQVIKSFKNNNKFVTYFLTNDRNKLLMSIENDESEGDLDIFISFLENDGQWSKPVSLGNTINTYASEFSPFLAADGKTLFFSSKGHPGYGMSDIFMSKRLDDTWTHWTEPLNLGPEINSVYWDGYFTLPANGEFAYLVSNKTGFGREDLFTIKLPESIRPEPVVLVSGKVFNAKTREPINAEVFYENLSRKETQGLAYSTIEDGYKISLPGGSFYGFRAQAKGYIPVSQNLELADLVTYNERTVDLYLVPIEKGQKVRLNNIFFDFEKWNLRNESFPELDRLVTILMENPSMKIEIGGHTDKIGKDEFNRNLSLNRARAVMNYIADKGIAKNRLTCKGYGETVPVASNDTEEGMQLNRRVEITILE